MMMNIDTIPLVLDGVSLSKTGDTAIAGSTFDLLTAPTANMATYSALLPKVTNEILSVAELCQSAVALLQGATAPATFRFPTDGTSKYGLYFDTYFLTNSGTQTFGPFSTVGMRFFNAKAVYAPTLPPGCVARGAPLPFSLRIGSTVVFTNPVGVTAEVSYFAFLYALAMLCENSTSMVSSIVSQLKRCKIVLPLDSRAMNVISAALAGPTQKVIQRWLESQSFYGGVSVTESALEHGIQYGADMADAMLRQMCPAIAYALLNGTHILVASSKTSQ